MAIRVFGVVQATIQAMPYVVSVLSQLTDSGRWHPVALIFEEDDSRYETHDSELLAIVEACDTT